jgi:uncharacterized protein YndB with AHSA1/START domain
MSQTVSLDFELKSPIERVWHALTDSAMLSRWTFFDPEDFRPVVGHRFRLRGRPEGGGVVVDCEVLVADPPHRLSYTWDVEAFRHRTTVAWTLTEAGDGATRLHLEQSGFDSDATGAAAGAKYAWTHMLNRLQDVLTPA